MNDTWAMMLSEDVFVIVRKVSTLRAPSDAATPGYTRNAATSFRSSPALAVPNPKARDMASPARINLLLRIALSPFSLSRGLQAAGLFAGRRRALRARPVEAVDR